MDVPIYYDPMLSKLIVHSENRQEAIAKMVRAIDDYEIGGVKTTLGFCRFAILHEAFVSGKFDTHFVKNFYEPTLLKNTLDDTELEATAILMNYLKKQNTTSNLQENTSTATESNWKRNRVNLR